MVQIKYEDYETLLHIMQARIDNSIGDSHTAWESARDCLMYAVEGNSECLNQFDYLTTNDEQEATDNYDDEFEPGRMNWNQMEANP